MFFSVPLCLCGSFGPPAWISAARGWPALCSLFLFPGLPARALDRTNEVFKIFQFPADQIPRIDGDTNDWNMVPESYVIGTDQLVDDNGKHQWTGSVHAQNPPARWLGQRAQPPLFPVRGR